MAGPNTIVLKGNMTERADETRAGGTITPGMLLSTTTAGTVVAHAVAAGYHESMFAKENYLQGKTIDDTYVSTDLVLIHRAQKGDEIYAWVPANAAAITVDDFLTSNGDGRLKIGATTDVRVAAPLENIDNSAVGSPARLRVRVL